MHGVSGHNLMINAILLMPAGLHSTTKLDCAKFPTCIFQVYQNRCILKPRCTVNQIRCRDSDQENQIVQTLAWRSVVATTVSLTQIRKCIVVCGCVFVCSMLMYTDE